MLNKFILFFLALFLFSSFLFGQQAPQKKDSLIVYKKIEKFSKQRKSTKFLYHLLFRPVKVPNSVSQKVTKVKPQEKDYRSYQGKIIRDIYYERLDPFGYTINDTSYVPQFFLYRAGNVLHKKTLPITIQNLLLFRKNQAYDSLRIKESERLIRTQKYIHDVAIYTRPAAPGSDSVDLLIRVLDNWSIIPKISASTIQLRAGLKENNFLGTGHQYYNEITWNHTNGRKAFKTSYLIPNIHNTYVNSLIQYNHDEYHNYNKGLAIDRPFFSTLAKWAAGASNAEQYRIDSFIYPDSTLVTQKLKSYTQDYWAGKSWQVLTGSSEDSRSTNLIVTGRFLWSRSTSTVNHTSDFISTKSKQYMYLAGFGIATRRYIPDKFIFSYGVTEDVPIGRAYGIVLGYQTNAPARWYLGAKIAKGNYHDWGYISNSLEYGTFIRSSRFEQGVIKVSSSYFTKLLEVGKWKIRQFVKPQLTVGIDREPSDSLMISGDAGIRGFSNVLLSGHHKMLLMLQTQSYAPWSVLGFRFGPYLVYSGAMLGTERSGFRHSRLYSQFGFGVLINNEFLVFNTFQVSFAFYPIIPGVGNNLFKYNQDKTSDIGFRDFGIGKPDLVSYQ